jgi:hypothetical protein
MLHCDKDDYCWYGLHPGVLGSIPKRETKQVQGRSRDPSHPMVWWLVLHPGVLGLIPNLLQENLKKLVLGVEWLSVLGLNFLLVSVSFTLSHTLSLDSFCTPTACQSSSSAGLFPLVYAYVVDYTSASPFAYSSSTHRFPDERTPMEVCLFQKKFCLAMGN